MCVFFFFFFFFFGFCCCFFFFFFFVCLFLLLLLFFLIISPPNITWYLSSSYSLKSSNCRIASIIHFGQFWHRSRQNHFRKSHNIWNYIRMEASHALYLPVRDQTDTTFTNIMLPPWTYPTFDNTYLCRFAKMFKTEVSRKYKLNCDHFVIIKHNTNIQMSN